MKHGIPEDARPYPGMESWIGRAVLVSSVGGCFVNEPGVVAVGPYQYPYKFERFRYVGKKRVRYFVQGVTQPQWHVYLPRLDRHFNFCGDEVRPSPGV